MSRFIRFAADGSIIEQYELPDIRGSLDALGVMATLNAVLGLWPLDDAARAVGLTADDLIHEAEAWAIGGAS